MPKMPKLNFSIHYSSVKLNMQISAQQTFVINVFNFETTMLIAYFILIKNVKVVTFSWLFNTIYKNINVE